MRTAADCSIDSGELFRLVADELAGSPVSASYVSRVSHGEDCGHLALAGIPGVPRSALTVSEGSTCVRWEYNPNETGRIEAGRAADIVTALLTGDDGPYPRLGDAYPRPGRTYSYTASVGRELLKRGLKVTFNPATDDIFYSVESVIDVDGPDPAASATIDEEGFLIWERDYLDPDRPDEPPAPAAIARDLAAALLRAARA